MKLKKAIPGDFIGFGIRNIYYRDLLRGDVVGDKDNPPQNTKSFIAQIILINHPTQIYQGYSPLFYSHSIRVNCKLTQFISKLDRRNGKLLEENPIMLKKGDAAIVKIITQKLIVVEKYSEFPSLGRFVLLDSKFIVAVGIIKEITKEPYVDIFA